MEGNIVTERVLVRERPDGTSPVIAELHHGDRIDVGQATFKRAWVQITLPDGRVGHIRGEARTRTTPMSHGIVAGRPLKIRTERDLGAEPRATAAEGQIIASGAWSPAQYLAWTEVVLPGGEYGYVEGDPHAQRIAWSQLAQKKLVVRNAPNLSGAEVRTLVRGAVLGIGPAANAAAHPWLRVILPDNAAGFIPPSTQITRLDPELRLRRLLSFPGKCISCSRSGNVNLPNVHLTDIQTGKLIGDCFVPICGDCIRRRFLRNMAVLFGFGTAVTVATVLAGRDVLGALAYVPFGFYSINAAHTGGTLRRYRRVAEQRLNDLFSQNGVEISELTPRQERDLDEIWPSLSKWIICPGCHSLHKEQAPWCPNCRYLLPWRFGPRP